jgi:membrane protease YdiL (CAAX protease family)
MGMRIPLALIAIGVAPLVEEVLFRGVLLSALMRRFSSSVTVLISATLFALVHLEGLHFQWYALPNLLLLALALGWLRLQSASLWPSVLAHGTYNSFAMIAILLGATTPQA